MRALRLAQQADVNAYCQESMLWFEHQSEGGGQVVVLPRGLEVVRHCQLMHRPAHHYKSVSGLNIVCWQQTASQILSPSNQAVCQWAID